MIDIYLDGADLNAMRIGRQNPLVKGFTTNPALMRSAGVTDYEAFCKEALEIVEGLPISFEVFSDEWDEMERQARLIASWGSNVYVKIPISDTKGESAVPLIQKLSYGGIKCNVTAVFTLKQVRQTLARLNPDCDAIVSIFAGRIADTGRNPKGYMRAAFFHHYPKWKVLWASPRQVLDIYTAEKCGCHIITITPELLTKYEKFKHKDLTEFSLQTVKMFFNDAQKAGYKL